MAAENEKRSRSGKKVVKTEPSPSSSTTTSDGQPRSGWAPSPEAKQKAVRFRIIAAALWAVAIGAEIFAIFWVLRQSDINLGLLIALIVVIGALAIGGSLLWKKANVLDPASEKDKARFFVQNQLGAIITIIAFLPLVVLILTNKNLSGKEKGIAGGVAAVVLALAVWLTPTWGEAPSVEQYDAEAQLVVDIAGEDLVFWTLSGSVYHLCADANAVNRESQDATIYSGTVSQAHDAGKSRITRQVDQEIRECGFEPRDPEATPLPWETADADTSDEGTEQDATDEDSTDEETTDQG